MYNIIKKHSLKAKPSPPRQQSAPSAKADKDEELTEDEKTTFEGLPICPVSGDSSRGCNRIACLHREKVKHPYYLINTATPASVVTRELPGRSRSDMMYDKIPKPEKPLPRCPPPLFPLPPRRDPLEEQQRRARLTEYRQRLRRYNEK